MGIAASPNGVGMSVLEMEVDVAAPCVSNAPVTIGVSGFVALAPQEIEVLVAPGSTDPAAANKLLPGEQNHFTTPAASQPLYVPWVEDLFAGKPAANGCPAN